MPDKDITQDANLTSNTAPALTDRIIMVDAGTGTVQDITPDNLLKSIALLTSDTTPDIDADSVAAYDNSGSTASRILLSNLPVKKIKETSTLLTVGTVADLKYLRRSGSSIVGDNGWGLVAPGGRLTLTSGTPVTTADVTSSTNIYYTPYIHNLITLWNGTTWEPVSYTELTLAIGTVTANRPYDVFGYLSGSTMVLEQLAWTSTTARATAVTLQDGRYCKSGDKTRLYLGTYYSISTTQTADADESRYLWNMYNRFPKTLLAVDTTNTWNYSTASWQEANASGVNGVSRFSFVIGIADTKVDAFANSMVINSSGTTRTAFTGIGLDSTTVNSANINIPANVGAAVAHSARANYSGFPAVGLHYLAQLEYGAGADTQTWYGDNGTVMQTGMTGSIAV